MIQNNVMLKTISKVSKYTSEDKKLINLTFKIINDKIYICKIYLVNNKIYFFVMINKKQKIRLEHTEKIEDWKLVNTNGKQIHEFLMENTHI